MHSSRMRTVPCSGRRGGGVAARGGVCIQGVCPGRCLLEGGVSQHALWTEFLTHAYENITFPQLRCGR